MGTTEPASKGRVTEIPVVIALKKMFFWAVEMAQRGKKKGPKTLSSNPQNLHKSQMHRAKGQKQENSKKLKGKKKN